MINFPLYTNKINFAHFLFWNQSTDTNKTANQFTHRERECERENETTIRYNTQNNSNQILNEIKIDEKNKIKFPVEITYHFCIDLSLFDFMCTFIKKFLRFIESVADKKLISIVQIFCFGRKKKIYTHIHWLNHTVKSV